MEDGIFTSVLQNEDFIGKMFAPQNPHIFSISQKLSTLLKSLSSILRLFGRNLKTLAQGI